MARIIVWAKPDNDHADPAINARKYKRGMVVDVLEDGQHAGNDVENGAWWQIVEVPGEPAWTFDYLLAPDPKFTDLKLFASEAQYPRKRQLTLDLAALASTTDKLDIQAKATATAKLDNPNVIAPVDVIG